MTLPLLLLKDSGVGQSSDDITRPAAIYASLESNLPKNCLHIEEYRQFLRSGGNAGNLRRPLKGRCDHIYFMQSKAVSNIACPRRRVSCMYDAYVSGTVIPLVEANVRSDNGEMGGSEPRLAVLSEVAGSPAPDSDRGTRCWIMHKFTEGLHTLLQNFPGAAETVNRHRGGLHSAESLLYLIHQTKNMNGNLKPDNQRMNFMLADSDVGFYLNGLGSQFEMAKNFIGLTLWCQNCNGNADTREKTRGTGLFVCCLLLFVVVWLLCSTNPCQQPRRRRGPQPVYPRPDPDAHGPPAHGRHLPVPRHGRDQGRVQHGPLQQVLHDHHQKRRAPRQHHRQPAESVADGDEAGPGR
ncbi:MAG: hypothetical protein CMI16_12975 [Opitutaceae bacterium]|nr:hypothetical protein [Opitutaceae bacterium]